MRSLLVSALAFAALVGATAADAAPQLVARISLSSQTMTVTQNGAVVNRWAVSTARRGYHTPTGSYRPQRLSRMWYSRKYDMSPMPHSIFFRGGYAIHGTGAVRNLGRPASHGCVRLHPSNAARLFSLVNQVGPRNTAIIITP